MTRNDIECIVSGWTWWAWSRRPSWPARHGTVAGLDERMLLERYVSRKDDAAFAGVAREYINK